MPSGNSTVTLTIKREDLGAELARRLIEAADVPTVFLDARVDELWRRCRTQTVIERPLLGNVESFRKLYEVRRRHYLKAQFRQETGGKTVEQIADEVVQALGLDRSRGKRGETQ